MKFPNYLFCFLMSVSFTHLVGAASTWTNGAGDFDFSTSGNWTPGAVPGSNADLIIATNDLLGFSNGQPYTAGSLTINAGISAQFVGLTGNTLTIGSGGLIMNGVSAVFDLPVLSSSTTTWQINSGTVTFADNFDITSGTLTFNFAAGTTATFGATPEWTGTGINFTGTITSTTIDAGSINVNNLDNITINGGAVEISDGYIVSAIPEPSTWAPIFGGLALTIAACRRRRHSQVLAA